MQFIIMFIIVLGLAFSDFITGYIKAKCQDKVSSKVLRIGGLHKAAELLIMATAIGLTVGFDYLGRYFEDTQLTDLASVFTAGGVFAYITIMEVISILENFAEINPQAKNWIQTILKNLNKGE